MNREIIGTVTVSAEEKLIFEHFAQELNILFTQISVNVDGSLRYEIQASLVMDILTLGEHLGIQAMSRGWKKSIDERVII